MTDELNDQRHHDRRSVIKAVSESPFACSALDDDRRFLAISDSGLQRLAPLTRDEVLGRTLYELVPPEHIKEPEGAFTQAIEEGQSFSKVRMTGSDGTEVEFNRVISGNVVPGVHVAMALDLPLVINGATTKEPGPRAVVFAPDELAALSVRGAISQAGAARVVATCSDPAHLPASVLGHRPQVVVIATSPFAPPSQGPQGVGLIDVATHLIDYLTENDLDIGILAINHQDRPDIARSLLKLGVLGVFGPTDSPENLVHAIEEVAKGAPYVSPTLAAKAIASRSGALGNLSPREVEVLRLVALGYTSQEVSEALFLSARTVESHRSSISHKIGSSRRRDLVEFAIANQIIP